MRGLVPFYSLSSDLDKWFDESFYRPTSITFNPRMDISEHKDRIEFSVDVPGLSKEDIKLNIEDNILTISGEKKKEIKEGVNGYYKTERSYGKFERSLSLPEGMDTSNIEASMKNGVLGIVIRKKSELKSRQVDIQIS